MNSSIKTKLNFLATLWLTMWVLLMAVPVAADSFDDAVRASRSGDDKKAFELFKPLALQGNANAQFILGYMYNEGKGVSRNYAEAVKWYRKAAEQGHAAAQYNLGNRYSLGQGVAQDHREAVKWYRKAAEQGHSKAQFNLGLLYAEGKGIRQDAFLAYKWLSLSIPGLSPGRDRDFANKLLKIIREKVPPADLAQAENIVKEWEAQHKGR